MSTHNPKEHHDSNLKAASTTAQGQEASNPQTVLNPVSDYIAQVCAQVRWKRSHEVIARELAAHMEDFQAARLAQGAEEAQAAAQAISEMGDPITVGAQFDRTYRPRINWKLTVLTILMVLLGFVMRMFIRAQFPYSPGSISNAQLFLSQQAKEVLAVLLGAVALIVGLYTDFSLLARHARSAFFSLCGVALAIYLFTQPIYGSYTSLQYLVMLFPPIYAGIIFSMRGKGAGGVLLCGLYFLFPALVAILSRFYSLFSLGVTCLVLLTVAVCSGWFGNSKKTSLLLIYIPVAAVFSVFLYKAQHRLYAMMHPQIDPQGYGYVAVQTQEILSKARFIGQGGVTAGSQDFFRGLIDDFTVTYLIHRTGWISLLAILALFAGFFFICFRVCLRQSSQLGRLVSLSVVVSLLLQTVFYLINNLGVTFLLSPGLPLLSFGNRALVVNLLLIGLLLSVFRTGELISDGSPLPKEEALKRFVEFTNGDLIFHFNNK